MEYSIIWVRGHVEVYDWAGRFCFSADSEREAREELAAWAERLPLKRLWNTSGQKYRQLGLAQRLPGMSQEEQLALLATDGMLVKRPVLLGEDFVLTGFREAEWAAALGK